MERCPDVGALQELCLRPDSAPAVSVFDPTRVTLAEFNHARSPFSAFLYSLTRHFSLAEGLIPSGGRPAVLSGGPGAAFRRSTATAGFCRALAFLKNLPPFWPAGRGGRPGTALPPLFFWRGGAARRGS